MNKTINIITHKIIIIFLAFVFIFNNFPFTKTESADHLFLNIPAATRLPTNNSSKNCTCQSTDYSMLTLTEKDILLIAALSHFETEKEPLLSKICFCAMILNRLKDKCFPSNVRSVVFDCGAFESAKKGTLAVLPSEKELETDIFALKQVLSKNIDPTCGALFTMKTDDPSLWKIMILFTVGDRAFGVVT